MRLADKLAVYKDEVFAKIGVAGRKAGFGTGQRHYVPLAHQRIENRVIVIARHLKAVAKHNKRKRIVNHSCISAGVAYLYGYRAIAARRVGKGYIFSTYRIGLGLCQDGC